MTTSLHALGEKLAAKGRSGLVMSTVRSLIRPAGRVITDVGAPAATGAYTYHRLGEDKDLNQFSRIMYSLGAAALADPRAYGKSLAGAGRALASGEGTVVGNAIPPLLKPLGTKALFVGAGVAPEMIKSIGSTSRAVADSAQNVSKATEGFAETSRQIQDDIKGTTGGWADTSQNLQKKVKSVGESAEFAAGSLPAVMNSANKSIKDIGSAATGLREDLGSVARRVGDKAETRIDSSGKSVDTAMSQVGELAGAMKPVGPALTEGAGALAGFRQDLHRVAGGARDAVKGAIPAVKKYGPYAAGGLLALYAGNKILQAYQERKKKKTKAQRTPTMRLSATLRPGMGGQWVTDDPQEKAAVFSLAVKLAAAQSPSDKATVIV